MSANIGVRLKRVRLSAARQQVTHFGSDCSGPCGDARSADGRRAPDSIAERIRRPDCSRCSCRTGRAFFDVPSVTRIASWMVRDVPPPSLGSNVVRSTISLGLVTHRDTSVFGGSAVTTSTISADTRPEASDTRQICSPGSPTGVPGTRNALSTPSAVRNAASGAMTKSHTCWGGAAMVIDVSTRTDSRPSSRRSHRCSSRLNTEVPIAGTLLNAGSVCLEVAHKTAGLSCGAHCVSWPGAGRHLSEMT